MNSTEWDLPTCLLHSYVNQIYLILISCFIFLYQECFLPLSLLSIVFSIFALLDYRFVCEPGLDAESRLLSASDGIPTLTLIQGSSYGIPTLTLILGSPVSSTITNCRLISTD